jgi:patatin-like phospholipase/acyl hydrolase
MLRSLIFLLSVIEAKYRILSLDSATYSGLMTAEFVSFMEKKAYLIARATKCLTKRDDERVAMHELFDMIAGSETGAIIASSLIVPHDDVDSP